LEASEAEARALLAIKEAAMKILLVIVGSDDGKIYKVDAIEHEGKLWLVPHWLDVPAQGLTKPARLIRMDVLPFQRMTNPAYGADFVLNAPVPKALLEPNTPRQEVPGFEVQELPEISFPISDRKAQSSAASKRPAPPTRSQH
jgi:hypothetical protein